MTSAENDEIIELDGSSDDEDKDCQRPPPLAAAAAADTRNHHHNHDNDKEVISISSSSDNDEKTKEMKITTPAAAAAKKKKTSTPLLFSSNDNDDDSSSSTDEVVVVEHPPTFQKKPQLASKSNIRAAATATSILKQEEQDEKQQKSTTHHHEADRDPKQPAVAASSKKKKNHHHRCGTQRRNAAAKDQEDDDSSSPDDTKKKKKTKTTTTSSSVARMPPSRRSTPSSASSDDDSRSLESEVSNENNNDIYRKPYVRTASSRRRRRRQSRETAFSSSQMKTSPPLDHHHHPTSLSSLPRNIEWSTTTPPSPTAATSSARAPRANSNGTSSSSHLLDSCTEDEDDGDDLDRKPRAKPTAGISKRGVHKQPKLPDEGSVIDLMSSSDDEEDEEDKGPNDKVVAATKQNDPSYEENHHHSKRWNKAKIAAKAVIASGGTKKRSRRCDLEEEEEDNASVSSSSRKKKQKRSIIGGQHDPSHRTASAQPTTSSARSQAANSDDDVTIEVDHWMSVVVEALRASRLAREQQTQQLLEESIRNRNEIYQRQQEEARQTQQPFPLNDSSNEEGVVDQVLRSNPDVRHIIFPKSEVTPIMMNEHFSIPAELLEDDDDDDDDHELQLKLQAQDGRRPGGQGVTRSQQEKHAIEGWTKGLVQEFALHDNVGALYEEHDMNEDIDSVLTKLYSKFKDIPIDQVLKFLARIVGENVNRIRVRHSAFLRQRADSSRGVTSQPAAPSTYESSMNSFHELFCRRCFVYDCNIHGSGGMPDHKLKLELAVLKEKLGLWKQNNSNNQITGLICRPTTDSSAKPVGQGSDLSSSNSSETSEKKSQSMEEGPQVILTEEQKAMCQHLYHVYDGDLDAVADVQGVPRTAIDSQVQFVPFSYEKIDPIKLGKQLADAKKKPKKSSAKGYDSISMEEFTPCDHAGPCTEETCTCVQSGHYCTKHCTMGELSNNFFRGCSCTGKCLQGSCPCQAAGRECDPDLCKTCMAGTDPPGEPLRSQSCCNDSIGMRRRARTMVGISTVSGLGLYNRRSLKRGEFIDEYVGELVDVNEGERRSTDYLFEQTDRHDVDSFRMGNKTRYINHIEEHWNVDPRVKIVNGTHRIGFYASKDIPAQSELRFNYGDQYKKNTRSKDWKK